MANSSPEIAQPAETQRAETAANRFFDMAEKGPGAKDPKAREMFSNVGRETAQNNYTQAQRILEGGAQWDDDIRGAASEINQLDQERIGAKPMTLEDAQKAISGYARDFEKMSKEPSGRQSDLEGAMAIDNIVADTSEPGIEGLDKALEYIEGTMKSKANVADSILKSRGPLGEQAQEFVKDWQEKRAIRDALFQEKQKRVEQMKQSQRGTEELTKGRGATATRLEQAFSQAGIPEDAASRNEFIARAGAMSAEELHFLDSSLNKAAREAQRSGDPKMLEGLLLDLSTKSFKRKDVEERQKTEDQRKIEEVRRSMGLPEQQPAKPIGRSEEEVERARKRVDELMPRKQKKAPESPREEVARHPEQEKKPVYEKITDTNFEQHRQQKEVVFDGKTWKIDSITPDGRISLHRDITIEEAVALAERAKKGEVRGNVDTPNVKTRARLVSRGELESGGQWIVEKPPRSPQNPERQKEVDELRALQVRLTSKEFVGGKLGEEDLLTEVFERDAQRLNQEGQDYERNVGKK